LKSANILPFLLESSNTWSRSFSYHSKNLMKNWMVQPSIPRLLRLFGNNGGPPPIHPWLPQQLENSCCLYLKRLEKTRQFWPLLPMMPFHCPCKVYQSVSPQQFISIVSISLKLITSSLSENLPSFRVCIFLDTILIYLRWFEQWLKKLDFSSHLDCEIAPLFSRQSAS